MSDTPEVALASFHERRFSSISAPTPPQCPTCWKAMRWSPAHYAYVCLNLHTGTSGGSWR